MLKLENELWADENGKAVPYNDIRGKTVLFGAGAQVTAEQMRQHGIREDGTPDEAAAGKPENAEGTTPQGGQDILLTPETAGDTADAPSVEAESDSGSIESVPAGSPSTAPTTTRSRGR